jgi:hypothetical protein
VGSILLGGFRSVSCHILHPEKIENLEIECLIASCGNPCPHIGKRTYVFTGVVNYKCCRQLFVSNSTKLVQPLEILEFIFQWPESPKQQSPSGSPYRQKLRAGVLGSDFRRRLGIFLFTAESRTALGSTQPPIQWVPGALSLWVKRPGREADHSRLSSAEVKNAWSCTSTPPVRLHGEMLTRRLDQTMSILEYNLLQ